MSQSSSLQDAARTRVGPPSMYDFSLQSGSEGEQLRYQQMADPAVMFGPESLKIRPFDPNPMSKPYYTPWHYEDWQRQRLMSEDFEAPLG